jgi:ankyrin repeat protein
MDHDNVDVDTEQDLLVDGDHGSNRSLSLGDDELIDDMKFNGAGAGAGVSESVDYHDHDDHDQLLDAYDKPDTEADDTEADIDILHTDRTNNNDDAYDDDDDDLYDFDDNASADNLVDDIIDASDEDDNNNHADNDNDNDNDNHDAIVDDDTELHDTVSSPYQEPLTVVPATAEEEANIAQERMRERMEEDAKHREEEERALRIEEERLRKIRDEELARIARDRESIRLQQEERERANAEARVNEEAEARRFQRSLKPKSEQLYMAVQDNNCVEVANLLGQEDYTKLLEILEKGSDKEKAAALDVNHQDDGLGETPFIHAAHNGYMRIVRALVNNVLLNFKMSDFFGVTPLLAASMGGYFSATYYIVEASELLREGRQSTIFEDDNDNWNALMYAADQGHWHIAQYLLQPGSTPMEEYVRMTVDYMLEHDWKSPYGLPLLNPSLDGITPAEFKQEQAQALQHNDDFVSIPSPLHIRPSLTTMKLDAIAKQQKEADEKRRKFELDGYNRYDDDDDDDNEYGVMYTPRGTRLETKKRSKPDISTTTSHGETPFAKAAVAGNLMIVKEMWRLYACGRLEELNIETIDREGYSPLLRAAMLGRVDVVYFLVRFNYGKQYLTEKNTKTKHTIENMYPTDFALHSYKIPKLLDEPYYIRPSERLEAKLTKQFRIGAGGIEARLTEPLPQNRAKAREFINETVRIAAALAAEAFSEFVENKDENNSMLFEITDAEMKLRASEFVQEAQHLAARQEWTDAANVYARALDELWALEDPFFDDEFKQIVYWYDEAKTKAMQTSNPLVSLRTLPHGKVAEHQLTAHSIEELLPHLDELHAMQGPAHVQRPPLASGVRADSWLGAGAGAADANGNLKRVSEHPLQDAASNTDLSDDEFSKSHVYVDATAQAQSQDQDTDADRQCTVPFFGSQSKSV